MVPNKPISTYASIKHGYAFAGEYFSKEKQDYILLTPGNFHIDQRLYFGSNTKYYNGPIDNGYVLSNGDLLVVMTDLTKDMAILGNAVMLHSDVPVLHNQRIGLVETSEEVSKEYLCCLLNSEHVRKHVKTTASGTTVRHTSPSKILSIKAYFPPLPEQQKIAKILSTWDKAISTTERLIDNSTQQKKSLMQQLLTGKKRLLDESGKRFEGEWEEVKLKNIGATFNGLTGKTKVDFGTGEPYITYMNIFKNTFISEDGLDFVDIKEGESQNTVKYGDIFFTTSSETPHEVGMSSVFLSKNTKRIYLNSFCFGFRPFSLERISPLFIGYMLRSSSVRRKIAILAQGATRYNLSKVQLLKISIKLPTIEEQQKIATVLTNADKEIELLKQQLADLQQEKKALMHVLLTGKKRVVVDNK